MRYLSLLLLLLALPAWGQDFTATVQWDYDLTQYSEPDGFNLYVSRDGGDYALEQQAVQSGATITASSGQVVQVQVSAVLGEQEGERSESSAPFTFIRLGVPTGTRILLQIEQQ